jgi:Predicted carbamoyl transferase, NodU family
MEYGPRALGNRSILGDPRNPEMQKKLNLKIKYREGFRPFAPSVLEEDIQTYFELDRPSPYMLLVAPVRARRESPRRVIITKKACTNVFTFCGQIFLPSRTSITRPGFKACPKTLIRGIGN